MPRPPLDDNLTEAGAHRRPRPNADAAFRGQVKSRGIAGWRPRVTRDEEIAAIECYLSTHKPTICRTVYVGPTSNNLSRAEEARRIAAIQVKKQTEREFRAAANRFYLSLRP
jgi:hypothetical protein